MGIPFIPIRGAVGSDYMRIRSDFMLIHDPYNPDERTVVVPAIAPDVAVLHGYRADRQGNVILAGYQDSRLTALASKKTIVTVEEVVEGPLVSGPRESFVSGIHITAVVHAPMAAHPGGCPGYYLEDREHLQAYMDATETPEALQTYLDRYVLGPKSLEGYLAVVEAMSSAGGSSG